MNEWQILGAKKALTVSQAAKLITQGKGGAFSAESLIVEGINTGEIAANIIRWENGNVNQMETTVKRSDLDEWFKARELPPIDKQPQDTDALLAQANERIRQLEEEKSLEKPLATNERHTLLTIVAALCAESMIKHQDRGAAGRIAKLTEGIGAPVTDDTIRKALAKVPDALEARMK